MFARTARTRQTDRPADDLPSVVVAYIREVSRPAFDAGRQNMLLRQVRDTAERSGGGPLSASVRAYVTAHDAYERHAARRAFATMAQMVSAT